VCDTADPAAAPAVFSGGSLLYGSVGRTDLVTPELTRELAAAQLRSAHRLGALPAASALFPTHGFGSFCAAGATSGADASTIGEELEKNPALRAGFVADFVDTLLASYSAYPAYYAHMAPANRAGAGPLDLSTPLSRVGPEILDQLLSTGATVVDLRAAADFADAHLVGTLSVNLGTQFATYVGWLTTWGGPLAVVGDTREQLEEARRQLGRIGIDEFAPSWGPVPALTAATQVSSYRRATFDELAAEATADDVLADVRRDDEYDAEHVRGARHIPLHELQTRVTELPTDTRVWVYCAGGFRAGTAASLIEGHVAEVVHVDDVFGRAVELGLTGPAR
jgi:hydroxyacylglutathione hydrolase